ncbi:MAG: GNAT family N-acetyltransferase, partial [Bacteroidota bacterium]|nr:GNAT family N-acetyltransferase [Bacteroidota bacterium]
MDKDLIEPMVKERVNMNIEFKRLNQVNAADLLLLMNHELVRRQMPLFKGEFTGQDLDNFIAAKEQLWTNFGYGPWAFYVDDAFVGWGGLQPESGEADLAMVLHPDHWGLGKSIYTKIIEQAFNEMGLNSITILLPQT